jgi:hypothetical protein
VVQVWERAKRSVLRVELGWLACAGVTVVVAGGHLTDQPDRVVPRFPQDCVPRVRRQIARELDDIGFGSGDLLICGGARGADLLAAEEALQRRGRVLVVLALPRDEFVVESVAIDGSDWTDRFEAVLAASDVVVQDAPSPGHNVFSAAIESMIARALEEETGERHAILVWNGDVGDGPGGTADLARRVVEAGFHLVGIDSTPAGSADRQWADGPKKLLALDGGGIRGALGLGILEQIQSQLRAWSGRDDLVLSDYFDYIGGTSTGAIIATALSLGLPVDEITDRYRSLGRKVFRFNWLAPFVSLHRTRPIMAELDRLIGADRRLGDTELRTLLLLVLHNTDTDSPWPVSNSRTARYNRPERRLPIHPERGLEWTPDRNLDLRLTELVRGSTAAPLYFKPQEIRVGERPFRFQDGGITPYNNPALLLYTMATQREYTVRWSSGEDELLVVSIGTGLAAAEQAERWTWIARIKNLPATFMNGASIGQDYLCRVAATTTAGSAIDSEIGRVPRGHGLFTYARYNVDLGDLDTLRTALIDADADQVDLVELDKIARIPKRKLLKLNASRRVDDLHTLGKLTGSLVDVKRDFAGFPP